MTMWIIIGLLVAILIVVFMIHEKVSLINKGIEINHEHLTSKILKNIEGNIICDITEELKSGTATIECKLDGLELGIADVVSDIKCKLNEIEQDMARIENRLKTDF